MGMDQTIFRGRRPTDRQVRSLEGRPVEMMAGWDEDTGLACFDMDEYTLYGAPDAQRTNRAVLDSAMRPVLRRVVMEKRVTDVDTLKALAGLCPDARVRMEQTVEGIILHFEGQRHLFPWSEQSAWQKARQVPVLVAVLLPVADFRKYGELSDKVHALKAPVPVSNGGYVVLSDGDMRLLLRDGILEPEHMLRAVDELVVYSEDY